MDTGTKSTQTDSTTGWSQGIVGISARVTGRRTHGTGFHIGGGIIVTACHVVGEVHDSGRQGFAPHADLRLHTPRQNLPLDKATIHASSSKGDTDLAAFQVQDLDSLPRALPLVANLPPWVLTRTLQCWGFPGERDWDHPTPDHKDEVKVPQLPRIEHQDLLLRSPVQANLGEGYSGGPVVFHNRGRVQAVGMAVLGAGNRPSAVVLWSEALWKKLAVWFPDQAHHIMRVEGWQLEAKSFPRQTDFVDRPEEIASIQRILFGKEAHSALVAGVAGEGGFGKTTLAQALFRSVEVARAFPGGRFWLDFGQEAPGKGAVVELAANLIPGLGKVDTERAVEELMKHFGDFPQYRVLVVCDDIWDRRQLEPLEKVLEGTEREGNGSGKSIACCRFLYTTRNLKSLPARLKSQGIIHVDVMSPEQSRELLMLGLKVSNVNSKTRQRLDAMAARVGHYPLLVGILKGLLLIRREEDGLSSVQALSEMEQRLECEGVTQLMNAGAEQARHESLDKCLGITLWYLERYTGCAERALELACFPPAADIPASAIQCLWQGSAGTSEAAARDIIRNLINLCLLRRIEGAKGYRIHNAVREFLRGRWLSKRGIGVEAQSESAKAALASLHEFLIKGYAASCSGELWRLARDEYMGPRMIHHLREAGRREEGKNLLVDYRWLVERLDQGGVESLLGDFEGYSPPNAIWKIGEAIRLASGIGGANARELAGQLWGRLHGENQAETIQLLKGIRRFSAKPQWWPRTGTLTPPGSARVFVGHTSPITTVAYHPNGKYALSGSGDDTLQLWDLQSGRSIRTFTGHTNSVISIAISKNGKLALSGSLDKTLRLWDIKSGLTLKTFYGHSASVSSVVFSQDGKFALSGSHDTDLRLWDLVDGRSFRTLEGHSAPVSSIVFSEDGKFALSGADDKTLKLWHLKSERSIQTLTEHIEPVTSVAISQDGKLALSGSDDFTLRLWDLKSGVSLHTLVGHSNSIACVSFSHDEKFIISGSADKTIRIWDSKSGISLRTLAGHTDWVSSVAFSPDGKSVLSGSLDCTLRHWSLQYAFSITPINDNPETTTCVAFAPDGKVFLSGSDDSTLIVWAVQSGKRVQKLAGHNGSINSVAFSPNGTLAISGSDDSTVRLWDLQSGCSLKKLTGHSSSVSCVAFNPNGKSIISGSHDGTLRIWDIKTGKRIHLVLKDFNLVHSVSFSPDGKVALAGFESGAIRIWHYDSGISRPLPERHFEAVHGVAFSPDGNLALSISEDQTIRLWDISKRRSIGVYTFDHSIIFAKFVPLTTDLQVIAGNRIYRINHLSGEKRETFSLDGFAKVAAFSPNCRQMVWYLQSDSMPKILDLV